MHPPFGILIKTVGDMIEKSFNKELNAGDSAKVYVAPQKLNPLIQNIFQMYGKEVGSIKKYHHFLFQVSKCSRKPFEIILICENFTPFGLLVDPEVYIIVFVQFISISGRYLFSYLRVSLSLLSRKSSHE